MRSFWDTPHPGAAPLEGEARAEVAIVGGGLAGLSAAYHLKRERPGLEIVVLEAGTLGGESSGRSTGMLGPGVGGPITHLRRRHGDETATRMFQATLDAVGHVMDLVREEALTCDLEANGQLLVATTERQAAALAAQGRAFGELGFLVPHLDAGEVARATGTSAYRSGLRFERAANLDPVKLCRELARVLTARGVRIHEVTRVRAVTSGRLELERGTVHAGRVVLATNAFTAGLGFLRGRVLPLHSHVVVTEPLGVRVAALGAGREAVFDARRFFNYYRLTKDDRLLFGGGAPLHAVHRGERPETYTELERAIVGLFPSLAGIAIERRWSGIMGFTLDRLPVVGEVAPGVLHAGAWCGHGIALSVASGALIAALVLDRSRPSLPWLRGTAPWLPPPRRLGVAAHLGSLGAADRAAAFLDRLAASSSRPSMKGALS